MAMFRINKLDAKSQPSIWRELKKNKQFKNARAAYYVTYHLEVLGVYPTLKEAKAKCHKYARDRLHSKTVDIITG